MTGNNPNLDLVNVNAYIKCGEFLSICSQDIECKQILTINGHNSIKMCDIGQNLSIRFQDIEWK